MKLLSTQEVATMLGISSIRVRQLISQGRLKAQKIGKVFVIEEAAVSAVRERKPGRPWDKEKKLKKRDR